MRGVFGGVFSLVIIFLILVLLCVLWDLIMFLIREVVVVKCKFNLVVFVMFVLRIMSCVIFFMV